MITREDAGTVTIDYMDRYGNKEKTNVEVGAGEYKFTEFVPGDYIVRFKYGEVEKDLTINSQDYKSSEYIGFGEDKSSAKDNKDRRWDLMKKFETITNELGELISTKNSTGTVVVNPNPGADYIKETFMYGDTADIKAGEAPNIIIGVALRKHEDANLAVIRRPLTIMKLDKFIEEIKITNKGVTLVDAKIVDTVVDENGDTRGGKLEGVTSGISLLPNGEFDIQLDNENITGAVISVTYGLRVHNMGEKDTLYNYFENVLKYGTTAVQGEIIKTRADVIYDYPTRLGFNEDINEEDWERIFDEVPTTPTWQQVKASKIISQDAIDKIEATKIAVLSTTGNTELNKAMLPGESTATTKLILSTIMAAGGNYDLLFDNTAEIVKVTNIVGRKDQKSIPGDYVLGSAIDQPDTANAITAVLDPFGEQRIYYLLGISIGVLLLAGIILIKKFAVKK